MALDYVSAQDKWIRDRSSNIRSIEAWRKTLARSFLDFAKMDLNAYKLLKNDLPSLSVFHLQQATEKAAKAMLIVDMNDIKYEDLKNHNFIYVLEHIIRKHSQTPGDINSLENAIFRQALTYASPKFLDFLEPNGVENRYIYGERLEEDIKLSNELVSLKAKLDEAKSKEKLNNLKIGELTRQISDKERKLLGSGLLTTILTDPKAKNKILSADEEEINSFILRDENEHPLYIFCPESRKALFPFFNILFITLITYLHAVDTRYPSTNGSIKSYTDTGIFKASDTISERLHNIMNRLEELNFL